MSLRLAVVRDCYGGGGDACTYAALAKHNGWDVTYWRNPPLSAEDAPGLRCASYGGLLATMHGADLHSPAQIVEPAELGYVWTRQLCEVAAKYNARVYPLVWQNLPWVDSTEHTVPILRGAAGFIARSSMACELLRLYRVGHERIHLCHASVDCERFTPAYYGRIDEGGPGIDGYSIGRPDDGTVRILYAGRFVQEKGVFDLLAALQALPDALRHRVRVSLIGGVVPAVGDLQITCVPAIPHHQMPDVYRAADVFVYPTWPTAGWLEQWGLSVVEAMACGLPVVTTDVGAFKEIHPPEMRESWTVAARDWVSLSHKLAELIEHPSLRRVLGARNREWCVSEFSGVKTAAQYRAAFGEG